MVIEAGRTLALRFQEKGQYLRSFVGREFAVHRHHDERRHHLLRGARDRRPQAARHRPAALPDHPARAGARRRLDGARRHLRSGNRRVSAADHAAGLSRRFLLVARAGLGAVWLCGVLRIQPRSALPRNGPSLRRLLHHAHPVRRRSALGFQRAARQADICWTPPRPRSPHPACCACAGWCTIRSRATSTGRPRS